MAITPINYSQCDHSYGWVKFNGKASQMSWDYYNGKVITKSEMGCDFQVSVNFWLYSIHWAVLEIQFGKVHLWAKCYFAGSKYTSG